jgi:hypothetical protein
MTYLALGLAFAAVGFLVANTAISLAVLLLWPALRRVLGRARALFWLRMLPGVGSMAAVFGLVLPAFVAFEPRVSSERVGPALVALAALAGALVAAGLGRAVRSCLATRGLVRTLGSGASRVAGLPIAVSVHRVSTALPLVALVGVVRPRLFVSGRVLDALSAEELRTVLDHERAHLASRDNLKRTLMRLTPDLVSLSAAGREIEARWIAAAEEQADEHAAGPGGVRRLELAASLLKAARMMAAGTGRVLPASNFCEEATVARRVSLLLQSRQGPIEPRRGPALAVPAALALVGLAVALSEPALRTVYGLIETVVQLLQ